MNAKYNFGGVSKRLGKFKVRVGQGDYITRTKSMIKAGHTDIELVEFGRKMTKAEICTELLKMEKFKIYTDIINETHAKKTAAPKAKVAKQPKVAKQKPVKAAKKSAKVVIEKKADNSEADDLIIEEIKKLVA